jgi:flagellar hook-length control protein FliK
MQTPPISAALPPASSSSARAQQNDGQAGANGSSFSDVLTGQQTTLQAATHAPKPGAPATSSNTNKPADKKAPSTDNAAPDDDVALTQAAVAQAAAEQGVGLPQIALDIAIQAAAAQHPATARNAAAAALPAEAPGKALPGASPEVSATAEKPLPTQALLAKVEKTDPSLPLSATTALPVKGADAALAAQVSPAGVAAALPATQTLAQGNKAMALTGAQQARLAAQAQKPDLATGKAALPTAAAADGAVSGTTSAAATKLAVAAALAPEAAQASTTPATGSFAATMAAVQVINNPSPNALPFATAQPAVATPLQSPQWSADFGRQFISLTQGGHNMPHTAELRLDPPELGPLRITINISDNVAHAIFASPHAAVRQTVENALPQLQQMLAQAGISLGQTSVSDQAQQEQAYNETFGGSRKATSETILAGSGPDGAITADRQATRQTAANALVDTFA